MDLDAVLSRIDIVLDNNKKEKWLLIVFTSILFLVGIGLCIVTLCNGQYGWSIPPALTTYFLKYPLKEIKYIREKNIALATAPALIKSLPTDKAAEEIQKLLVQLYPNRNEK